MVNATWCALAGSYLTLELARMPDESMAGVDPSDPNSWAGVWVKLAAYPFLAWLSMDFMHCFHKYPHIVGLDAFAHHGGFILLTLLQMSYEMVPIVAAWLLLSEISTLPLNVRWFLISFGRGDSRALFWMNMVFAACFFFVRVLLYWAGVAHMLLYLRPMLLAAPFLAPPGPVYTFMGAVTAAGFLNLWWMHKIVLMASKAGAKKETKRPERRSARKKAS